MLSQPHFWYQPITEECYVIGSLILRITVPSFSIQGFSFSYAGCPTILFITGWKELVAFPKGSNAKWKANSLSQDLNSCHQSLFPVTIVGWTFPMFRSFLWLCLLWPMTPENIIQISFGLRQLSVPIYFITTVISWLKACKSLRIDLSSK